MPESSDTTAPGQPKIATFAPELIDEILHHLVEHPPTPASHPGPKSLGPYALVSQVWRGPVQRRLFRRLVIHSGTQAERIAEGLVASGLHSYVHTLAFESSGKEVDNLFIYSSPGGEPTSAQIIAADGVTADHFSALLPLFPDVVSLHLTPTFTHFRPSDLLALKSCPFLPRLSELWITTRLFWRTLEVDLIYDLLILTPELSILSLTSRKIGTRYNPSQKPPVTLPRLRSLQVIGQSFAPVFVGLGLLSTSTISQISDFTWKDSESRDPSALPLLELMGPSLKTVHLSTRCHGDRVSELQKCTAVERVSLSLHNFTVECILPYLPSTTHTITVPSIGVAHRLLADLSSPPAALQKVILTRGRIYKGSTCAHSLMLGELRELEALFQACKRGGIELVVYDDEVRKMVEDMA